MITTLSVPERRDVVGRPGAPLGGVGARSGFQSGLRVMSSGPRSLVTGAAALRLGACVALGDLVAGVVVGGAWAADLRLRDHAVAAEAPEILDAGPAVGGVALEKGVEPGQEPLDHVGADRLVEHGGGAHLHRAAAQQDVAERLGHPAIPPIPEKLRSGNARVSWAILASESGRIAGPPRPPMDTRPSTLISNSSVSASISGSDGKVLEETIALAPPRKHAAASTSISAVTGVSLHHTGTVATSFTASVTTEQSPWSLPMLVPMSRRSMWGRRS